MGAHYALTVTTEPTIEPVTLEEAKTQCRVTDDAEDSLIEGYITSARQVAERYTNRAFINTTYAYRRDSFPVEFHLPRAPLSSVTTIQYVDTAGDTQTLSSSVYNVDIYQEPGRISEAYGQQWPSARGINNAVIVTYVAGYGATAATVPQGIKDAIMILVNHFYGNRGLFVSTPINTIPMSAMSLLDGYVVYTSGDKE